MEEVLRIIKGNSSLRYFVVFLTSALADFWSSFYFYAISHHWIVIQALIGFWLPFINIISIAFFIEARDGREKLMLTTFSALGMTIGATIMLLLV